MRQPLVDWPCRCGTVVVVVGMRAATATKD
jgi:hypothetical protein